MKRTPHPYETELKVATYTNDLRSILTASFIDSDFEYLIDHTNQPVSAIKHYENLNEFIWDIHDLVNSLTPINFEYEPKEHTATIDVLYELASFLGTCTITSSGIDDYSAFVILDRCNHILRSF